MNSLFSFMRGFKEIKQLIGASVERVGTGSRQVQAAGNTMTQIVDSVRRVTQMIGEIRVGHAQVSPS